MSDLQDEDCQHNAVRQDVKIEDAQLQEMLQKLHRLANVYNSISNDDQDLIQRSNEVRDRKWKIFRTIQVQKDPPISLAIIKEFGIFKMNTKDNGEYPPRILGQKTEKIIFRFFKGSADFTSQNEINMRINMQKDEIGDIILEHEGMVWNLTDRYVQMAYREKGFASALLKTAEAFVEDCMRTTGLSQKIIMNAGQPSVLSVFEKKGYKPKAEDTELLQRVLVDDGSFELDFACIRGTNDDGSFGDEWIPELEKDLYCFEPGISPRSEQNAIRITLEKPFISEVENADIAKGIDSIRNGVGSNMHH